MLVLFVEDMRCCQPCHFIISFFISIFHFPSDIFTNSILVCQTSFFISICHFPSKIVTNSNLVCQKSFFISVCHFPSEIMTNSILVCPKLMFISIPVHLRSFFIISLAQDTGPAARRHWTGINVHAKPLCTRLDRYYVTDQNSTHEISFVSTNPHLTPSHSSHKPSWMLQTKHW